MTEDKARIVARAFREQHLLNVALAGNAGSPGDIRAACDLADAAIVAALLDAVKAEREECAKKEWLPIETAPKDGTYVLLGDYLTVDEGYYIDDGEREGWWMANTHWTDAQDGQLYPTHWQPMPARPIRQRDAALAGTKTGPLPATSRGGR